MKEDIEKEQGNENIKIEVPFNPVDYSPKKYRVIGQVIGNKLNTNDYLTFGH